MNDLDWIRAKLEVINKRDSDKELTTKQFIDKRAMRENMIKGDETIDSEGYVWNYWNGLFFELTGRKPTDQEFISYSDWIDKEKREVNIPLYDQLKVWFDKNNIKMLPKIKEDKNITNEEIEKRINIILKRIYAIRGENYNDL